MLKLYQPATKSGVIDLILSNTGATVTQYPLAEITRDVNMAKDNLISIAIPASGKWQVDDSGHTDYNIIYTNLVANQRDYSFVADENGNLILDIYRVMVADENGIFYDLEEVDQQNKKDDTITMVDEGGMTGRPTKYDITANGIFFDVLPSYSYTKGVKVFVTREGKHYSVPTVNVADNTASGIDPRLDEYLAIRPTAYYAQRKGLKSANFWANELLKYEGNPSGSIKGLIAKVYGKRMKDEPLEITAEEVNPI